MLLDFDAIDMLAAFALGLAISQHSEAKREKIRLQYVYVALELALITLVVFRAITGVRS